MLTLRLKISGVRYLINVKSDGFRSVFEESGGWSHTEELLYNETVCLGMTIYIFIYIYIYIYIYIHTHTHTYIYIRIAKCRSYIMRSKKGLLFRSHLNGDLRDKSKQYKGLDLTVVDDRKTYFVNDY